jgi:hypothetical protein
MHSLSRAREALFRLSNFWVYIDIGADPEFRSQNIDWEKVVGEDLMLLDQIIEKCQSWKPKTSAVLAP